MQKAYDHFFLKPDGAVDCWVLARGDYATVIRTTSQSAMPEPGAYEVCSQTTLRLAWCLGRIRATEKSLVQEFEKSARCIAVQFCFLPKDDDARKKRRQLEENIKASESLMCLVGYKEALSTNEVRDFLKSAGRPSTSEAVAAWYASIKWSDQPPTRKTVEIHLKVASRCTGDVVNILDQLESLYGKRHPLATIGNLDVACQKTSCKNAALQEKLLAWVCEGILVRILRGTLSPSISGERLKKEVIPVMLCLRRIASYISYKIDSPLTTQLFQSFRTWHFHYPKGRPLDGANMKEIARGSIKESEEMSIASLTLLFDGTADPILLKLLMQDPNASAEALLGLPELARQEFLNFEAIMSAWHAENPATAGEVASEPVTPAKTTSSLAETPTPSKSEPQEMTEKPEMCVEEQAEEGNRMAELWPHLVLPNQALTRTLAQRHHARCCKL